MRQLLLAGLLLGPLAGPSPADSPRPVTVPFELLKSGHMAVQVKVNGKGPYLLIFDTGAPMSLLTSRLAREAKLLSGQNSSFMPGFGTIGEAKIKTLQVGDQKVEDVGAIVMDHPTVEALAKVLGKKLDGIVGFPFFARFKLTLDYEKKTMTLVPSGYTPPDVMTAMTTMMIQGAPSKALAPAAQWGVMASKLPGDAADGIDVKSVVPGSAADKAGLKGGDRLLTLDGRWTDSLADLYEAAGHVKPGTTVIVRVRRGGKETDLKVTPTKGL
jgi:hypothetical protein